MTILDAIVEHKRVEVQLRKQKYTLCDLQSFSHYERKTNQIVEGDRPGIIAEFKRKSPSKGDINPEADPALTATAYKKSGVAAMSVLTDRNFFGGSFKHLQSVREAEPELPVLRKDFMIDPYQLHEAKAYGADIILLIAAILDPQEIRDMAQEARTLNLQVLLEVHNRQELESWDPAIKLVGVNNRNLKDFSVDISRSMDLLPHFPKGVIPVSESGLSEPSQVKMLHKKGFRLFLMGENFMKQEHPGKACQEFIRELK